MSKFNVGDMVIMTREPTDKDWEGIGEVEIPYEYYTTPQKIVEITQFRSIVLADNIYGYPSCCFELASIQANTTHAKQGDYIKILYGHGNSNLQGKTYYVVKADECHFKLAIPGKGDKIEESWACSNPSYYEIITAYKAIREHEIGTSSDICMSNYEPPPPAKEFKVGDTVKVVVQNPWFHEGEVATIKEIANDCVKIWSNKHNTELWARNEYVEEYLKTNKNQQNGTSENNNQSIKLQRVNLKIREGNPVRGIGLKSSRSKIKLGSNYSYN